MGLILSEPNCIHIQPLPQTRRYRQPHWAATFDTRDDLIGWGCSKDAAHADLITQGSEAGVVGFEAGHALPVVELAS